MRPGMKRVWPSVRVTSTKWFSFERLHSQDSGTSSKVSRPSRVPMAMCPQMRTRLPSRSEIHFGRGWPGRYRAARSLRIEISTTFPSAGGVTSSSSTAAAAAKARFDAASSTKLGAARRPAIRRIQWRANMEPGL